MNPILFQQRGFDCWNSEKFADCDLQLWHFGVAQIEDCSRSIAVHPFSIMMLDCPVVPNSKVELKQVSQMKMKREALSILLPSLIFPGRLLLRLRSLVTFREMITRQILFAQGIFKLLSRANSQFLERL